MLRTTSLCACATLSGAYVLALLGTWSLLWKILALPGAREPESPKLSSFSELVLLLVSLAVSFRNDGE